MKIQLSILFLFLFPVFKGFSQFKKTNSFSTSSEVIYAAVDRPGELYLVLAAGTIQKVNTQGELQGTFSHTTAPTIFDPRDGARVFAYYRAQQEYVFLTPSLATNDLWYKIDPAFAITPQWVCTSGDYNLIILDAADWQLKKISTKTSSVLWEADISQTVKDRDIIYMREYQNFIFLLDHDRGILVFNSMGKFLRAIEANGLSYFNFLGEELYYLHDGKLKFFDLFTTETRETALPAPCTFALLTDEHLYTIRQRSVEIFELKP